MGPIGPIPDLNNKKSTYGSLPSDYKQSEARAFEGAESYRRSRDNSSIDFSDNGRSRGSIVKAIAQNIKRKEDRDDDLDAKAKKAKEMAEQYKAGSFKVSDDVTVMPGYQDPGFQYTIPGSKGFGGLIGTVGGAFLGGPLGVGAMTGAQLGGSIGSYF